MSWKDLQPEGEQVREQAPEQLQKWPERVLDVDPGHVRALAHYSAMLDELHAQEKSPAGTGLS